MNNFLKILAPIALCLAVGLTAAFFTQQGVHTWYVHLHKPPITPPNKIFPMVWTVLYIMMGISLGIIWIKSKKIPVSKELFQVFGIQLFLNFLWSFLFFEFHNITLALLDIMALWLMVLVTMGAFYRYSPTAACLLAPYWIWVGFAMILNYWIWLIN